MQSTDGMLYGTQCVSQLLFSLQKTPIVLDMHAFESARKLNQWLPTKCNIYILLYNAHMATSVRVHATHQWWW